MQPLQQQHGNQGCPNLDAQSVLAGSDESLHLEVLLHGFEGKHSPYPVVTAGRLQGGAVLKRGSIHAAMTGA